MFYTYILHSPSSGKFYIGQTNNLDRRLQEHNVLSEKSFTALYRPWTLLFHFSFKHRAQAMAAEKYLKKKPRSFIRKVIVDQDLQNYIFLKFSSPG